jgi:hypothetical protein
MAEITVKIPVNTEPKKPLFSGLLSKIERELLY